jgi:PAS domain S-box-containing protein
MPEMTTLATDALARCEERARKLARDKSYLQLVNNLMLRLSEVTGVETVVENMLRILLDNLGGTNVSLYYFMDADLYYADVYGRKRRLEAIDDEIVKGVFDSCKFVEVEHDFEHTRMLTPEFTKASTWAVPLMVASELVGVLKLEDMLMAAGEIRQLLEPFLKYSALVLRNELSGYARLEKAYNELSEANARLSAEILQRREAERTLHITQFAVDHASDCLFWITPDAGFANVNESTCRRLGYSRDELLTMTVFDVDPAFPREGWEAHWQEIKERKSFTIETMHRTKAGESFPAEVTVNYVEYEGAEYNFAFARDISERKRAEDELRKANKELESRLAELRRMNQLFVGRELRMIELKEKIKELEQKTGE